MLLFGPNRGAHPGKMSMRIQSSVQDWKRSHGQVRGVHIEAAAQDYFCRMSDPEVVPGSLPDSAAASAETPCIPLQSVRWTRSPMGAPRRSLSSRCARLGLEDSDFTF